MNVFTTIQNKIADTSMIPPETYTYSGPPLNKRDLKNMTKIYKLKMNFYGLLSALAYTILMVYFRDRILSISFALIHPISLFHRQMIQNIILSSRLKQGLFLV
mmetsp:Transcript_7488/g.5690  ORF Transcript_7488/g.5690 Transcript_7488/m.5690 type:complete len:103 (-) Transcript_7488:135-443(-)